jgi:hypothetical protein
MMNNTHPENGTMADPLIFTVPAYGFVMALYLDWLGCSHRGTLSAEAVAHEVHPIEPSRLKPPKQAMTVLPS